LLIDHGLASMAVTCHAFGIQNRNSLACASCLYVLMKRVSGVQDRNVKKRQPGLRFAAAFATPP